MSGAWVIAGDGMVGKMPEGMVADLLEEARVLATEMQSGVVAARCDSDDVRLARWDGQAPDGLKHADYNGGTNPKPFEGASDVRVRLADLLVNERVMLCVMATLRASVRIVPMESRDTPFAAFLETVHRHVVRNVLGWRYVRELVKLGQYVFGDSPAVGVMGVAWRRERELALQSLSAEELMGMYVELVARSAQEAGGEEQAVLGAAEGASAQFLAALGDETWGAEELGAVLMKFFPYVKAGRAKRAVKELRETGACTFPVPYVKYNGVELTARRLFEDVFLPVATTDFQRARCYFEPEWLGGVDILERAGTEGWSEEFVEGVLGKDDGKGKRIGGREGMATFPDYVRNEDGVLVTRDATHYRGQYQILRAYFRAVNDDGIPGRYLVTLCDGVTVAAHAPRLLPYLHGKYPGHLVQREVLTSRVLDSRGLPELAGPLQGPMKVLIDCCIDNGQVGSLPPVLTRGRRTQGELVIAQLAELELKRDGDVKFMQPPAYPVAAQKMFGELRRMGNEQFGRPDEELDPSLARLQQEFDVMWWLQNMREIHRQILELVQQFATDEELARITGRPGQVPRSREEIQGQFDAQLSWDPKDLDLEYLKMKGEIIRDVLKGMDQQQTLDTVPVVAALLHSLWPEMAEAALRPVEVANRDEAEDELRNIGKIRAGVEPPMVDDGSQNYPLRLGLYQQIEQANPAAFADLAEDKRGILEQRLKHLQQMVTQFGENQEIGRTGARRATGGGGIANSE